MLDTIPNCEDYDVACHVEKMTINTEHSDRECSALFASYNELNSSGEFLLAAQALNAATSLCSANERELQLTVLANYYSPLGSMQNVVESCQLLSSQGRTEIKAYLDALNVDVLSCGTGIKPLQTTGTLHTTDCDFTCQVKSELKSPNPNTIAGQFAIKFNLYRNEPDLISKLAVYFEKQYEVSADIVSIRDYLQSEHVSSAARPQALSEKSIELHKGTMALDKFEFLVQGARYAQAISAIKSPILVDAETVNVIPYAKSNAPNLPMLSLGGAPLFNNKQPGLAQVYSLYGSLALAVASESGRGADHIVVSERSTISKQLEQLIKNDNLVVLDHMDTDAALAVVRDITSRASRFDDKGQAIIDMQITIIGNHIFAGFLTGTIKVKVSSQSKISWRVIPTNMKDFTKSELRDMPGFHPIIPTSVLPIFNAFRDQVIDTEATLSNFVHYLVGYHSFIILNESNNLFNCRVPDYPKKTDSGDFVTCP